MITQNGKELIAKFLLSDAPAYATHIGLGCGTRPGIDLPRSVTAREVKGNVATLTSPQHGYRIDNILDIYINDNTYNGIYKVIDVTENTFSYNLVHNDNSNTAANGYVRLAMSEKETMDFEMLRIPISSKGYVNDNGVTKIVFAAEMPTTERLLVSEASLWSAGSNANAANVDSRQLWSFSPLEGWKFHDINSIVDIPTLPSLSNKQGYDIRVDELCFFTPSDTPAMTSPARSMRYEPGRFGQHVLMLNGYTSTITSNVNNGRYGVLTPSGDHIHIDTVFPDLSKNSPNDELRLAFSVVSEKSDNPPVPNRVRIVVEFVHSESVTNAGYARMFGEFNYNDIANNRYCVLARRLSDLRTSPDFDWAKVRTVKIYAAVINSAGQNDPGHFVALDGMRFENVSSPNPLYAMTGYSVYNDGSVVPQPIHKIANTSNYLEFRTNLGVM